MDRNQDDGELIISLEVKQPITVSLQRGGETLQTWSFDDSFEHVINISEYPDTWYSFKLEANTWNEDGWIIDPWRAED